MNIDWGAVLKGGFELVQKQLGGNGSPLSHSDDTTEKPKTPVWVWVLAAVAAALMFGKKLFK